jgi:hypothetical protein
MLNSEITRNNYVGDDLTSTFSYTFKVYSDSEVKVIVRELATGEETLLVKTTDYTVTGAGVAAGGTIVLVSSGQAWLTAGKLSVDYVISITRSAEYKQTTDIKNLDDFYPDVHETVFDKIFMRIQQLLDLGKRSLRIPESINPTDFDMQLPGELYETPDCTIVTNPTGDGWALGPNLSEITNAVTSAAAAAVSETNAAISAAAALASQNSASLSAANAGTSETNALASEAAAAASAADAAASAASIDVVPYVEGDRAGPTAVTAGVGVVIVESTKYFQTLYIEGDGGAVNITANPQIASADNSGTKLRLIGCSNTNTVTLEDGTGLELNGPMVLASGSMIELEFDGTLWLESFRNGL